MVIEDVCHHPGVLAELRAEPFFGFSHNGVRICERVNEPVQPNALLYPLWIQQQFSAAHAISDEVAQTQVFIVARQK